MLQIGIDWGMFVLLSHVGIPAAPANMIGRVTGATLGFWANGKLTFASECSELGRKQVLRFILLWSSTTLASTLAMVWMANWGGIALAWKAKPMVDLALSGASFLMSRHWVYGR